MVVVVSLVLCYEGRCSCSRACCCAVCVCGGSVVRWWLMPTSTPCRSSETMQVATFPNDLSFGRVVTSTLRPLFRFSLHLCSMMTSEIPRFPPLSEIAPGDNGKTGGNLEVGPPWASRFFFCDKSQVFPRHSEAVRRRKVAVRGPRTSIFPGRSLTNCLLFLPPLASPAPQKKRA